MTMFSALAKSFRKITGKHRASNTSQGVDANLRSRDATSAIEELSRAVQNDTDSVEIYLALGNLYRLRGDIERAVHIRRCLIARPGLEASFRARALLELGRDYRRGGFIDRAQNTFQDAIKHGADKETVWCELAALYGDSGAFDQAAIQHRRIGNPVAEAHYLTRHAQDLYAAGQSASAQKTLVHAIKVYSGSIEAWISRISIAIQDNQWTKAKSLLEESMKHIALDKRFLVFNALLELPKPVLSEDDAASQENNAMSFEQVRCDCVLPVIEAQEPDLLLAYYAALFLLQCHKKEEAHIWLEKAIVLQTNFWAARYQMLTYSMEDESLSPVFKGQLLAFMDQANNAPCFVCQHCGFKRDQAFYLCPKCRSWHSATFRTSLQD
ncbi:MAG: tetratricopeptide repeat protein [Pseudomonadota bacterium]